MKKNWAIFIVICVLTYGWMLMDASRTRQEYEAQVKAYKEAKAEWDRRQEEKANRRAAQEQQIAASLETAALATKAADPQTTLTPEVARRELIRIKGNPELAALQVVETPLYRVTFSELGARAIRWEIRSSEFVTNSVTLDTTDTAAAIMPLIPQTDDPSSREYPFELSGTTARDFNDVMFQAERTEGPEGIRLAFTSDPILDGLRARKEFFFRRDSYVVDLQVEFLNGPETRKDFGGEVGFGIGWQGGFGPLESEDRIHGLVQALYSQDGTLRTRHLSKPTERYEVNSGVQWAGQEKRFFVGLLFPDAQTPVESLRIRPARLGTLPPALQGLTPISVELLHPARYLEPGGKIELGYQVYVGPKSREALSSKDFVAVEDRPKPSAVVFHYIPLGMSFLRWLCLLLLDLMRALHDVVGVWGLAIIGTTLVVRAAIYPITHWSIRNTARTMVEQEKIRPELQAINKKYKDDPAKRTKATMQLWQEHGINPAAGALRGCLPALLQMPIFMALYVLFEQSVELRGQSFLWIADLSQPDRLIPFGFHIPFVGDAFNILPILMAVSNYFMMKIMQMPAADETQEAIQKQMMLMMPFMIVIFVYHLPSGLTLYYTLSNAITVVQGVVTKKMIEKHRAEHEARLAARPQPAPGAAARNLPKP